MPGCVDFHAHLDDDAFAEGLFTRIDSWLQSSCALIVTVADPFRPVSLQRTLALIQRYPQILAVAGAHPHEADKYTPGVEKALVDFINQAQPIAIGEIGLDFHYHFSSLPGQESVFRRQLALAREFGLPVVIHSREAEQRVLDILAAEHHETPVVFHCYSGTMELAREILQRGYALSISGVVTFPKAEKIRAIAREIPLDRLFTETDSPYLSPEPFRGQTNTPERVSYVVAKIAEIRGLTVEEINGAVSGNLSRLRATR